LAVPEVATFSDVSVKDFAHRILSLAYRDALLVPEIRELTLRCRREPECMYNWLKARIFYMGDPPGMERLKSPALIFNEIKKYGKSGIDCDDASALAASVLIAAGFPVRLRTSFVEKAARHYSFYRGNANHVSVEFKLIEDDKARWIPFDLTHKEGFGKNKGKTVSYFYPKIGNGIVQAIGAELAAPEETISEQEKRLYEQIAKAGKLMEDAGRLTRKTAEDFAARKGYYIVYKVGLTTFEWFRTPHTWIALAGLGVFAFLWIAERRRRKHG